MATKPEDTKPERDGRRRATPPRKTPDVAPEATAQAARQTQREARRPPARAAGSHARQGAGQDGRPEPGEQAQGGAQHERPRRAGAARRRSPPHGRPAAAARPARPRGRRPAPAPQRPRLAPPPAAAVAPPSPERVARAGGARRPPARRRWSRRAATAGRTVVDAVEGAGRPPGRLPRAGRRGRPAALGRRPRPRQRGLHARGDAGLHGHRAHAAARLEVLTRRGRRAAPPPAAVAGGADPRPRGAPQPTRVSRNRWLAPPLSPNCWSGAPAAVEAPAMSSRSPLWRGVMVWMVAPGKIASRKNCWLRFPEMQGNWMTARVEGQRRARHVEAHVAHVRRAGCGSRAVRRWCPPA